MFEAHSKEYSTVIEWSILYLLKVSFYSIDFWEMNFEVSTSNCDFVSPSCSINFCVIYFEALLLGAYAFKKFGFMAAPFPCTSYSVPCQSQLWLPTIAWLLPKGWWHQSGLHRGKKDKKGEGTKNCFCFFFLVNWKYSLFWSHLCLILIFPASFLLVGIFIVPWTLQGLKNQ
jgi:hypothetical protein